MPEDGRLTAIAPQAVPPLSIAEAAFGLLGFAMQPHDGPTPQGPEATFLSQAADRAGSAKAAARAIDQAMQSPPAGDARLCRIAGALGFGPAETAMVALALAVETDALAGRAVAYLQAPLGGARPTLGLLASVLAPLDPGAGLAARLASGPAVASGLLRMVGTGPLPERGVCLPDGLISALSGAPVTWPGLSILDGAPSPAWPQSLTDALSEVAAGLSSSHPQLLVVRSAAPNDRGEVLLRLGARLGLQPALLDFDGLDANGLGPLCVAAELLPAFEVSPGPGEFSALPVLSGYEGPVIAFIGPDGQTGRVGLQPVEWSVPLPNADERVALWRGTFPDDGLAQRMGADHLQSAGRIRELCDAVAAQTRMTGKDVPDVASLRAALWATEGEGLGALAQPVRDEIPDAAMIAGPGLSAELAVLLARCRRRERLTQGLGAALTARYKVGVRSLFTGPSGTGKTLAAAWLSGKLNLALYRVDLAAVSSKYIGETEKNLSKLLARAEEQEVVLLFDEADSLFGKRTDISDSNDRFANAQTNYLLQRIETYSGIVLLTSNARNRFDEAFTRRIDLIIDFIQPQPSERLMLWRAHLGDAHAVTEADLNRLSAMAELAGGHIRNVVLMAAVLSQEDDAPIAYGHVLEGLKAEYRKLGWTVPAELLQNAGRGW